MKPLFKKKKNNYFPEDEEFISDKKASLLTKVTPVANIIIYAVIFFFIVGIIWAAVSQIDVVVNAAGKVIPSSKNKIIQSLDGGIIKSILVTEGQLVKQNQPVLILDDTRYKAEYDRTYQKYLTLLLTADRLTAEVDQKNKIDFPENLKKQYPDLIKRETHLFETRRRSYQELLSNLENSYKISLQQSKTYKEAFSEGIVSKIDYLRQLQSIDEIRQRILELKSKHWEEARTALIQTNSDLNSIAEELKGLKDKMVRTTLRSPVQGIVKKINVSSADEAISPFMNVMEVVPLEDSLLVQVRVKPSDIAFVHKGQPASVQFTAYDYSIYGQIEGKVEYVSADAIEETKPISGQELTSYYLVNIRTKQNFLETKEKNLPIFPGMDANAKITTGKKTILLYLLKPLIKAKEEALRER